MEKRHKKRLNIFKFIRFLLIVAVLVALPILGIKELSNWHGFAFIGKDINLKTLEVPDYVDVQLLDIGNARTGEKLRDVNGIVVHYVGNPDTSAQNNHDYFAKEDTVVCSHFVIGTDGEIIQCVPLDEKSAASNDRNIDTISIEVCHPDKSGKFTDASVDSLVKLCKWLCSNSGLKEGSVIRHYDVTGKKCPLYYVDNPDAWKDLLNRIFDK